MELNDLNSWPFWVVEQVIILLEQFISEFILEEMFLVETEIWGLLQKKQAQKKKKKTVFLGLRLTNSLVVVRN